MKSMILTILFLTLVPAGVKAGGRPGTEDRLFSVGAGYGIPYGHTGLNLELNPLLPAGMHRANQYLSFSLGLGYKQDSPLFAMGFNFYPLGRSGLVSPRFSFHYTKMDRILNRWNTWEEDYDTLNALTLGGGLGFRLNESLSFLADAFYLFHIFDDFTDDEIGGRFKFSLGARFNWETKRRDHMTGSVESQNPAFMQIGIGAGIPYGGFGVNLEFSPLLPGTVGGKIRNYLSILAGSGLGPAGSSYSLGMRIYPLGKEKVYRPRLGLHFGTVGFVKWGGGNYSSLEGLAFSAGTLYRIGPRLAVDADLVLLATLLYGWRLQHLDSPVKASFGLRWLL